MNDSHDPHDVLHDPDVQLMLCAKEGDSTAFDLLVAKYQERLVGMLTQLLHNQAAAEDIAQQTFLRVYRARERYEPTCLFATWLFRIAKNLASNQSCVVANSGPSDLVTASGVSEDESARHAADDSESRKLPRPEADRFAVERCLLTYVAALGAALKESTTGIEQRQYPPRLKRARYLLARWQGGERERDLRAALKIELGSYQAAPPPGQHAELVGRAFGHLCRTVGAA